MKPGKKTKYLMAVPLMAAAVGGLFSLACGAPNPEQEMLRPVRVQSTKLFDSTRVRTFSGSVRADIQAKLSFKVAGTIETIQIQIGDLVEEGQLLARLDPVDYERAEQQAAAQLASTQATARNAAADYARVSGLYEDRNASKADLDAARAKRESAEAQVTAAKKQLEQAQANLRYTRLLAPRRGAVLEVRREENENIKPGDAVVVLASGARPEIEVAVPEVLIAQVKKDQKTAISLAAVSNRTFTGRVIEVGISSTGTATTFPVVIEFVDGWGGIRAGMAAEVEFEFDAEGLHGKMVVPPFAVGEDSSGRHVFVAEPAANGTAIARRKSVVVGELLPEGLEISNGLDEGELLITAGVSRIRDGQTVLLPQNGPSQ